MPGLCAPIVSIHYREGEWGLAYLHVGMGLFIVPKILSTYVIFHSEFPKLLPYYSRRVVPLFHEILLTVSQRSRNIHICPISSLHTLQNSFLLDTDKLSPGWGYSLTQCTGDTHFRLNVSWPQTWRFPDGGGRLCWVFHFWDKNKDEFEHRRTDNKLSVDSMVDLVAEWVDTGHSETESESTELLVLPIYITTWLTLWSSTDFQNYSLADSVNFRLFLKLFFFPVATA